MINLDLLNILLKDEKKINKDLYSSGQYWKYKNERTVYQIKNKNFNNFRGLENSIGTSFADNIIYDYRNELNVKGRILAKFFSLPVIKKIFNGQLNITYDHIINYLNNLSEIYKNNKKVLNLIKKYKFKNTTEFGCLSKFSINNKEYSTQYLEMAYRINILKKKYNFKKIINFFEIGSGFGANIHFLQTNFPNIKKIICLDAVPNIFIATEYLKKFYGSSVKDYLFSRKLKKISFADNNDLEIFCIAPWQIESLNVEIDHFHNACSFVEMPDKIIKNYCKYIDKNKAKEISLISYYPYDKKTTFDPKLLNKYFSNKLKIKWHDTLINESNNKKLIFLTS
jgi:putative sugar O-methyltransferase